MGSDSTGMLLLPQHSEPLPAILRPFPRQVRAIGGTFSNSFSVGGATLTAV